MENMGIGAGLAALAFWGFVAAVTIAGIWDGMRKRESQHETLRRLLESGRPIDDALLEKLSLVSRGDRRLDRDFYITAMWLLPISVGMLLLGLILGSAVPDARMPLLGVSALLACLGIGWLVASKIVERRYSVDPGNSD